MDAMESFEATRIVPVLAVDSAEQGVALARALASGGLPIVEITFRTEAAVDAIRAVATACPDVLVGAGSVLLVEQAQPAVDAGARFVVSPGLDEVVVERTMSLGCTALPGCATASDLMRARRFGLDLVKLFPAEALGGLPMLAALAAPFPGLRFVPTGGIGPGNLAAWLADARVAAVGGSWMTPPALVRARRWDEVTEHAREAIAMAAAVDRAKGADHGGA
jgi:2-dehydro-3-deoxyphosphogluconate aldolase/(4S)-4-hydroxy-2-oxoglutarate aldolase